MKLGGIRQSGFCTRSYNNSWSCRAGRRPIWGAEVRTDETARGLEGGSCKRLVQMIIRLFYREIKVLRGRLELKFIHREDGLTG